MSKNSLPIAAIFGGILITLALIGLVAYGVGNGQVLRSVILPSGSTACVGQPTSFVFNVQKSELLVSSDQNQCKYPELTRLYEGVVVTDPSGTVISPSGIPSTRIPSVLGFKVTYSGNVDLYQACTSGASSSFGISPFTPLTPGTYTITASLYQMDSTKTYVTIARAISRATVTARDCSVSTPTPDSATPTPTFVCSDGQTRVPTQCPDGSTIYQQACHNNAWYSTYASCPQQTATPTPIATPQPTNEPNPTYFPPQPTQTPKYTCPSGQLVDLPSQCPEQNVSGLDNNVLIGGIALLGIAGVAILVFLRRR